MRTSTEDRATKAIRRILPVTALLVAVGCATGTRQAVTVDEVAAATDEPTARPAPPVNVEQTVDGFTITQQVSVTDDVRADYEAALRMMEQGRYPSAIAVLQALTGRAPDVTAAHIALGVAHARADDLEQAEASLRRALELDPSHPVAHNELGLVQRRTGDFSGARVSYEAALAHFADFHYAHRNLAILCDLYLDDPACALEHYEAYRRIVPADSAVDMWIADLRNRAGHEETP